MKNSILFSIAQPILHGNSGNVPAEESHGDIDRQIFIKMAIMGNTTNMTAELMGENMSKQLLTFVCGSKATPNLISAMKKLSAKNEAILKRGKNIVF